MKLIYDYLSLRDAFPHIAENENLSIAMAQISQILCCTPRNVKLILTKMIEQGWIYFQSGRGRGNASKLTFIAKREDLLFLEAKERIQAGEVEEAFAFIQKYGEGTQAKVKLLNWFSGYFGYTVEEPKDLCKERLRLPFHRKILSVDPREAFYALDAHLVAQIYDTLVRYDDVSHGFLPQIAHHWEVTNEGTSWKFYLRKGVFFHHGRECWAEDVAYTITRLQESYAHKWWASTVKSVEILSRYAIKIELHSANYAFLNFISLPSASIVAKDAYELGVVPSGTGPYQLKKLGPYLCVLEAYDSYFQGRAWMDTVELIYLEELEEQVSKQKDVLLIHTGEWQTDYGYQKNEINLSEEKGYFGSSLLTLNQQKEGPLQDQRFRQALDFLIDRHQLVDYLGETRLCPSIGFSHPAFTCPLIRKVDKQQAIQLLQKSSYQGEVLHLYVYQRHFPDANWIQQYLSLYGVQVKVTVVSWEDLLKSSFIREADLILYEVEANHTSLRILEVYQSQASFLRRHMSEQQAKYVDDTIKEALALEKPCIRLSKLKEMEEVLLQQIAFLPLVYKQVHTTFHSSLQGVQVNSRGWIDFHKIWFRHKEE